jgi:hypothetical protein
LTWTRVALSALVVQELVFGFNAVGGGAAALEGNGVSAAPASARAEVEKAQPIPRRQPRAISLAVDSAGVAEDPAGCQPPGDDYSKVEVNGFWLDERTYEMLQYAHSLYAGPIDIRGPAITQGSFSNNGPESFGTHLGGGAVDISVLRPGGSDVLYSEIEPLLRAMRAAGFAAWLREPGELGPGSPIHVHAIAIGDQELSPAAADQLTGPFGYFRGFTGVPTSDGVPIPDHDGSLVLCNWMVKMGYADLRASPSQGLSGYPAPGWGLRLAQVASSFVTSNEADTVVLARRLHFLANDYEDPSNMCGPLAAAILAEAGMLPSDPGPLQNLKSYWLANPQINGRPWSLFPPREFQVFRFKTPVNHFDYSVWPFRPGDLVFTYAGRGTYDHMFVVTEVDGAGRAYTVTNERQLDGGFLVQRVLLYDPARPEVGALRRDWVDNLRIGMTGLGGFDVLRRRGLSLPPGTPYEYRVGPGDTLADIVRSFSSSVAAVLTANPHADLAQLGVGQILIIPVGPVGE